jgi:signal transduction histidine kinase
VIDILSRWFANNGHCSLRAPDFLWSYVMSDTIIAIAYYSIPLALFYFVRKRRDVGFSWIFVLFSAFIVVCGTAHLLSIWTICDPDYRLDALMKAVTAVTSVVTAILLWPLISKALKLPNSEQLRNVIRQLEHEIVERKHAEEALRQSEATLRELAAYQEKIREEERKRIAREIHDELGQNLLALRIDISMLHARTGAAHPRLKERAKTALDYIDTTMKSVRTIMNNLRPAVLDIGLPAAIEWQVSEFRRLTGIACELAIEDRELELGDQNATAIFRILQESLTNVSRHSQATQVRIALYIDGGRLSMTVKDNGVGIYPGNRRKANTFGLVGIRERITMLGGELTIDSIPNQGTVLKMSIPMGSQDRHAQLSA